MIKNSGDNKQRGWRLPATQLEHSISQVLTKFLSDIGKVTKSISDLTTNEAANLHDNLAVIETELSRPNGMHKAAMLIHRINLQQGTLTIELDRKAFAKQLQINPERISADLLTIKSPFQLRKRGVETKLVLGNPSAELDQTLIRYVAKAHSWYEAIKQGSSFENIAVKEDVSAQRIRQLIGIAFLAPDIVKQILEGKQSIALTSEWLQRNNIPSCWEHQRRLIANL